MLQAFPGCVFGVSHIGYVMVSFGIINALSSMLIGPLEKWTNRRLLFLVAVLLNLTVLIVLLLWPPENGPDVVFYLLPGVWAVADSIWQVATMSAFRIQMF